MSTFRFQVLFYLSLTIISILFGHGARVHRKGVTVINTVGKNAVPYEKSFDLYDGFGNLASFTCVDGIAYDADSGCKVGHVSECYRFVVNSNESIPTTININGMFNYNASN